MLIQVCGGQAVPAARLGRPSTGGALSRIGTRATGAADEIVGKNGIVQDIRLPKPWATVDSDGNMNFTANGRPVSIPIIKDMGALVQQLRGL